MFQGPYTEDVISVLIVENHPIFRGAVREYIETCPDRFEVVDAVGTSEEAIKAVTDFVPDLVLMDLNLRDEYDEDGVSEGVETIQRILVISPHTKVVVLSYYYEGDVIARAVRSGAAAYLLKDKMDGPGVINSLLRVHAGTEPIDPDVARRLYAEAQKPTHTLLDELTSRELEVLRHAADGKSNKEIAKILCIAETTVKKHISNIYSKLQLRNRIELMRRSQEGTLES